MIPLKTRSFLHNQTVQSTTPRSQAQTESNLLNLRGMRELKIVCFQLNCRQGWGGGVDAPSKLMMCVAQCQVFWAMSHSQNRWRMDSIAPEEHVGQLRSMVALNWPRHSLTVRALFQALHISPASLTTLPLDHTVVHLNWWCSGRMPVHLRERLGTRWWRRKRSRPCLVV